MPITDRGGDRVRVSVRMTSMSAAHEVSADDPHQVAAAIARAAGGEVVHLVRDGRPIADVVPARAGADRAAEQAWARAVSGRMAARFGAPTLEHYRHVYTSLGQLWPGEEEVRRRYPVADAR